MDIPASSLEPFGVIGIPSISYNLDGIAEKIIEMIQDMTHDAKGPPDDVDRRMLSMYAKEMGAERAGVTRTMSGYEFGFTLGKGFDDFYSVTIYTNKLS